MDKQRFKWEDPTVPVYLHYNYEKFWEIKLDPITNKLKLRCGKLDGNKEEVTSEHEAKGMLIGGSSISHGEDLVMVKLEKGYQVVKKEDPSKQSYHINIIKANDDKDAEDPRTKRMKGPESPDVSIKIGGTNNGKDGPSLKRKNEEVLVHDNQKKVRKNEEAVKHENDIAEVLKKYNIFSSDSGNEQNKTKKAEVISIEEEKIPVIKVKAPSPANKNSKKVSEDLKIEQMELDPDAFLGEYLTNIIDKRLQYCKIQVLDRFVKIENGVVDNPRVTDIQIHTYPTNEIAVSQAKRIIVEKINKGYKPFKEKFLYSFRGPEVGLKDVYLPVRKSPQIVKPNLSPKNAKPVTKSFEDDFDDSKIQDSFSLKTKPNGKATKRETSTHLSVNHKDFDALSDSNLSKSFLDESDEEPKRKEGKRSRPQTKSASPERRNQSTSSTNNHKKHSLGDPVKGCYTSLLEAYNWESQNIKGWFWSEKLDGIRCFWSGTDLWLRSGKKISPPDFFTQHFPKSPLDGELWAGRSNYQQCVTAVNSRNPVDKQWKALTFKVLDAPEVKEPFEKRYEIMRAAFAEIKSPYIELHEQKICQDREHLMEELEKIEKENGEGIMLRDPKSFYEKKRSKTLLKVKSENDEEALVVKHEPGKGKNEGKLGALRVVNSDDVEFSISLGLTDAIRKNPPKIGERITYKYRGKNDSKVPKYPTFLKVCDEMF